MSILLGPTFSKEIFAAGLGGLQFSWTAAGEITGRENLTAEQNATLDAVIAAHNPFTQLKHVIRFPVFIARWTDPEYALLLQKRAVAINVGNVTSVKMWDMAAANGEVDLNSDAAVAFKAVMVSNAILTQARADAIFNGA